MILGDDYAGHRHWWDPYWKPDPALIQVWTDWDFALLRAYQIIEDYTLKTNGQLIWVDQSPEVDWDVESSFSGHDAALEIAHKNREELKPGETLIARPSFRNPEDPPSMTKWLEDMETGNARPMPADAPGGARPPTPEELEQIRAGKLG